VELQGALERNPDEARAVVSALLEGGQLTATPIETENGRRFLREGTAVVGRLLACEPVSNLASPTGFESATKITIQHKSCPIRDRSSGQPTTQTDAKYANANDAVTACDSNADPIERALSESIGLAAAAGQWSAVSELGRLLAERQRPRQAPGVASLDAARAKRGT
jgi:hypothetical protein